MASSLVSRTRGAGGKKPTPQLSCNNCRERKIKCDKLEPCTNCATAGLPCKAVFRPRLPRGRHAVRTTQSDMTRAASRRPAIQDDDDLNARLRRIEALVNGIQDSEPQEEAVAGDGSHVQQGLRELSVSTETPSPSGQGVPAAAGSGAGIGIPNAVFWSELVKEVHGLRTVVESNSAGVDVDIVQAPDPSQFGQVDGRLQMLGFGNANPGPAPDQLDLESREVTLQLCDIYLAQVDPVIKILHRPSIKKWLQQNEGYHGHANGHIALDALRSAMFYSAVNSMPDSQCMKLLKKSRSVLLAYFSRVSEDRIGRCGLLTTRDIVVLQAFALYLSARRTEDRSRAVPTLLAVAVSIGRFMRLNVDADGEDGRIFSFFELQMRRRLWYTLCLIDVQSSVFQASDPLIGLADVTGVTLPAHINDADFDESTPGPVPDKEDLTDTTFAVMTYKMQMNGRLSSMMMQKESRQIQGLASQLADDEMIRLLFPESGISGLEACHMQLRKFEDDVLMLLRFCDPEESAYSWFTWHGTQCFVVAARLTLSRLPPLPPTSRVKPVRNPEPNEKLRLAIRMLEKARVMFTDPRGEGFSWYITIPWPVLAIAIRGCYDCSDVDLVRRSWSLLEGLYQQHEAVIAKYSGGILRGPLAKLMRQTRQRLNAAFQGAEGADATATGPDSRNSTDHEFFSSLISSKLGSAASRDSAQTPSTVASSTAYDKTCTLPLSAADSGGADDVQISDEMLMQWEQFMHEIENEGLGGLAPLFTGNDWGKMQE